MRALLAALLAAALLLAVAGCGSGGSDGSDDADRAVTTAVSAYGPDDFSEDLQQAGRALRSYGGTTSQFGVQPDDLVFETLEGDVESFSEALRRMEAFRFDDAEREDLRARLVEILGRAEVELRDGIEYGRSGDGESVQVVAWRLLGINEDLQKLIDEEP